MLEDEDDADQRRNGQADHGVHGVGLINTAIQRAPGRIANVTGLAR